MHNAHLSYSALRSWCGRDDPVRDGKVEVPEAMVGGLLRAAYRKDE